jgi:peroxiredoxin
MRHVFALTTTALFAFSVQAAEVGKPAPDFKATDVITGKEVTLASLKGKPAVLEWNNFDCPFVKKFYSVGAMQALQAKVKKGGVTWVTVNSSAEGKEGYLADAATAKTALAERKAVPSHYLLDHDGSIGKAYGAKTTPHMFVIDKEGTLAYAGAIDDKKTTDSADIANAKNYVTAALADIKAGKPVAESATRAYGCSVKY